MYQISLFVPDENASGEQGYHVSVYFITITPGEDVYDHDYANLVALNSSYIEHTVVPNQHP